MMEENYAIVADNIAGSSGSTHEQPSHVRGTRQVIINSATHQYVRWSQGAIDLDLHGVADGNLNLDLTSGFYVPQWGTETPIDCVEFRLTGRNDSTFLTLLHPRPGATAPNSITSVSDGARAALAFTNTGSGAQTWISAATPGVSCSAGPQPRSAWWKGPSSISTARTGSARAARRPSPSRPFPMPSSPKSPWIPLDQQRIA